MIEIQCSCGAEFEVLNEQVAQKVRCPRWSHGVPTSSPPPAVCRPRSREPAQFQVPCGVHPDQVRHAQLHELRQAIVPGLRSRARLLLQRRMPGGGAGGRA